MPRAVPPAPPNQGRAHIEVSNPGSAGTSWKMRTGLQRGEDGALRRQAAGLPQTIPILQPRASARSGAAPKGASGMYWNIEDFVSCHNDGEALQNLVEVNGVKYPEMHGTLPHKEDLFLLKCHHSPPPPTPAPPVLSSYKEHGFPEK